MRQVTRAIKKELCMMKDLTHDNVNRFVGACLDPPHVCIVSNYCSRGSLKVKLNLMCHSGPFCRIVFLSFVTKTTVVIRFANFSSKIKSVPKLTH